MPTLEDWNPRHDIKQCMYKRKHRQLYRVKGN